MCVESDSAGNFYICDWYNYRIRGTTDAAVGQSGAGEQLSR
ncbi:MAG: hypothetical protein LC749_05035 [Actinobacteria bacterium]|nr:hypothetical protein [Actinomycetota bacterium]